MAAALKEVVSRDSERNSRLFLTKISVSPKKAVEKTSER